MAGFIHVSKDDGCSMGSHHFRRLVSSIREFFEPHQQEIVRDLYEYFDETSDCLLVLCGKDQTVFMAFVNAFQKAIEADPDLEVLKQTCIINELIGQLESDARFKNS